LWFNEYLRNGYLPNNNKAAELYKKYSTKEQIEWNFGEVGLLMLTKISGKGMNDEIKTRFFSNSLPFEMKMLTVNSISETTTHYIFEEVND
jgi:hypothetical protein